MSSMEKLISITLNPYNQRVSIKKAPDYMQLQTLNLLNEWEHYKRHLPPDKVAQTLEGYIMEKYGYTAEQAYNNYNALRAKIYNDNKARLAV